MYPKATPITIEGMRFALFLLFGMLVGPIPAFAWGDLGHKVICEIALATVAPTTRTEVERLIRLDGAFASFADACTWPDHPRKRAAEHFVNLPRDAKALQAPCGDEQACVVSAISKDFAVLSSKATLDGDKAASLKYLGHWVGDVHQPLHVSFKDDRGGNSIKTSGICGGSNLHSVWDSCLVEIAIGTEPPAAAAVNLLSGVSSVQTLALMKSTPADWANESFAIVKSGQTEYCKMTEGSCDAPSRNVNIDSTYIRANVPIVREQLLKAGLRLARLLDQAVGQAGQSRN